MNQVSSNPRAAQPVIDSPDTPHAEFLGLPFCLLSQREAVRLIIARCGAPYRYVVTPNAYHVVKAHDEPTRLLPVYRAAWLSFCDSRILRALAWLEGRSLPLVTGSDLVAALLSALNVSDAPSDRRRLLIVGPHRRRRNRAARRLSQAGVRDSTGAARPRRRRRTAACRRSRLRR